MAKARWVEVNDRMQQGYAYQLTEPAGRNFHPDFRPELTPGQMLELGVFGGRYMTDCKDEFPADWFANAKLCPERHDPAAVLLRRLPDRRTGRAGAAPSYRPQGAV